ncbi:MAG: hypothetical protein NTW44_06965 [Nitrospirae bacterium]|nr:hypothetical protein [Nitrospirota bacterium]
MSSKMMGKVVAINTSDKKGMRKKTVEEAAIEIDYGIEGDAHASSEWHRQVTAYAKRRRIFVKVIKGGKIKEGDIISI